MDLQELLLDWLPTKTTKVLLLLTVLLTTTPFLLPEYVVSEIQLSGKAQLWLLKLAVSLLLLLLGSLAICVLVVRHYMQKGSEDLAQRLLRARARENRDALR